MAISSSCSIHLHLDHLLLMRACGGAKSLHLAGRVPLRVDVVHLEAVSDALQGRSLSLVCSMGTTAGSLILGRLTAFHQVQHRLLLLLLLRRVLRVVLFAALLSLARVLYRDGPLGAASCGRVHLLARAAFLQLLALALHLSRGLVRHHLTLTLALTGLMELVGADEVVGHGSFSRLRILGVQVVELLRVQQRLLLPEVKRSNRLLHALLFSLLGRRRVVTGLVSHVRLRGLVSLLLAVNLLLDLQHDLIV